VDDQMSERSNHNDSRVDCGGKRAIRANEVQTPLEPRNTTPLKLNRIVVQIQTQQG
jgi:hypothetical protein